MIASINYGSRSDFKWESTELFRTEKGAFFLAGEGGALSRWAQSDGCGGRVDGSGIEPLDPAEALEFAEATDADPDVLVEIFGNLVEEA